MAASAKYPQRKIGDDSVSAMGLGCMGMTWVYSSSGFDDEQSFKVLTRAADLGINFWDTSDIYGPFTNEQLIGRWFKETGRRDEIFLATKFGARDPATGKPNGTPEYVKQACAASLERLQTDRIDLYYQHRVDQTVPIEKTVQAMAELKKEGKIRYLGLSECSATTLRRACKVHPIAAAQMEFSPFALEIESEQTSFLKTARELGVKIVAYSPLARGFVNGLIRKRSDLDPSDFRYQQPRFSEENFPANVKLVDTLAELAKAKGYTPGQFTLAWILSQGDDFIPIPGTKKLKYLEENAAAANVTITKEDNSKIRDIINSIGSKGDRYIPAMMASLFADSPELDG